MLGGSVKTKVEFCPPAGAGPPAGQITEHLAGAGPSVRGRRFGKYRTFGQISRIFAKNKHP